MKAANKSKLKRKLLTRTTSAYTLLEQEIAILKKLDHPNIV
jgi:[calcium/calmodulin-dependent protein kinase] kinase